MLGQQLEVESDRDENASLYYYITDNITIQFGREEFCLVTGLRFGVENFTDYNDLKLPIPFRRRVFPSCYDGEHITDYAILEIIEGDVFDRLHDEDAVSLCCLGILQFVLLGVEAKRRIPNWMLRLANDRTWILESFRVTTTNYYYRYNRYPRVAAWKKKKGKFMGSMVHDFFHGMNVELVREANTGPIIVNQHFGISDLSEPGSMQSATPYWQPAFSSHPGGYNWQSPIPSYMGYLVSVTFWQQLVPHLCMPDIDSRTPMGWLSEEHVNAWMEVLIRYRRNNDPWTVAYTKTISIHPENQRFLIETNQHTIGTLDGSTRRIQHGVLLIGCFCPYMLEEIIGLWV
nr:hypothetical protein [Tanacetum cinerariifolium]